VRAARWRGTDIRAAADVRVVREEAREHARVAAVEHLYQRCPALRAGDDVGLVVAVDICSRDGYELKSLTSREGLIYFYLAWAPDNHALAALACKEDEWNAREKQFMLPAGRPRLISIDGDERLLDDQLTEAWPVWSPDSSKVATGFDTDVGIYDAATTRPSQARLALREALLSASHAYETRLASAGQKNGNPTPVASEQPPAGDEPPPSFNPIVSLEWPVPEKLYIKTAYVRLRPETINTFQRWHLIVLSPQAAVLK